MNIKYNPQIANQNLVGNHWECDCPICGKVGHFYMNIHTGLWDCKKCGEVGNFYQYKKMTKLGSSDEQEKIKEIKNEIKKNNKLPEILEDYEEKKLEKLQEEKKNRFVYKKPPTIELPSNFKKIPKHSDAYNYIIKRKYDKNLIKKHNILYGTIGKYFNRIIIPVYLNGKLKAYLGRWIEISGYKPKKKYINSWNSDFSLLLGNYDFIDNTKPVIICEGAFSAYRIGFNSVYSFGKKLSKSQIYLLKKKKVKKVLLLFDADAQVEIVKIAEKLLAENFKVKILLFEDGDPDDLDNSDNKLYYRLLKQSKYYEPKQTIPIMKLK